MAAWAVVGLGCQSTSFTCLEDASCGDGGTCEANGYCSFPDSLCLSGRRYGEFAGSGLSGTCVQEDASATSSTTTGSSTSTTGDPPPTTTSLTTALTTGTDATGTTMGVGEVSTTTGAEGDSTTSTSGTHDDSTGIEPPPMRVEEGLTILYRLAGGDGDTIVDLAPGEPAIDLTLQGTGYSWTPTGLLFTGDELTGAYSTGSLTKLNEACLASDAITVEAWVTPTMADISGPPRLVSYSLGSSSRNVTLAVGLDIDGKELGWKGRLRTSTTDDNGQPDLTTVGTEIENGVLVHVAYVHESSGDERIVLDGVSAATGLRAGAFVWTTDGTMSLALGNEVDSNRPLDGEVHLAAIYCRALTDAELAQNFAAGF